MTYAPWREIDCPGVVVKAQDFLTPSGQMTNKYYELVKKAGGVREFLGCECDVILSSIMPDKMIYGFSIGAYSEMIDTFQPDGYYTPDGETYLTKEWISRLEIDRVFSDAQLLIQSFPHIKPIGLVKGCSLQQIDAHSDRLLRSGVTHFVFHAGDFLCRGSSSAIAQSIYFASSIRQKVPWLVINGAGAMSTFKNFSFADGFVTQSHFVNAFYGQFSDTPRGDETKRTVSRDDIMKNLRNIQRNVTAIQLQKCLTDWILYDQGLDNCLPSNSNGLTGPKGGS